MVHDVLGTPLGGQDLYLTEPPPKGKSVKLNWRRQFLGKKVRISEVQRKVEESQLADLQFKLNFLMLFLSTMAECNSCGYVILGILAYIREDTDISNIDWSKYVLGCLETSKDLWKLESDTYSGPITFLTLLYVSITECSLFKVDRTCPAICFWNTENLRRREGKELNEGGFGTVQLIDRDITEKEKSCHQMENEREDLRINTTETSNDEDDTDDKRTSSDQIESEEEENQTDRMTNTLKDYKDTLRNFLDTMPSTKEKATLTIHKAIAEYPFDLDLKIMYMELRNMFNEHTEEGQTCGQEKEGSGNDPMDIDNEDTYGVNACGTLTIVNSDTGNECDQNAPSPESVPSDVGLEVGISLSIQAKDDLDSPTTQMHIDKSIEEYHRKNRTDTSDFPKFDLGVDSPTKNLPSPTPLCTISPVSRILFGSTPSVKAICDAPVDSTREKELGRWLRSPYVERIVDLHTTENTTEKKIVGWINAAIEPICERVFETSTGYTALRGSIESLCARTKIFCNVIDCWAELLNHEERSRNISSPRRFFMHTTILTNAMLDNGTNYEVRFQMFYNNILSAVGGNANAVTFKDVDLLFFPIVKDLHFYVVVFNLKHPTFLIIDNLEHNINAPTEFEEIPDTVSEASSVQRSINHGTS